MSAETKKDGFVVLADGSTVFQVGEATYTIPKATKADYIEDHRAVEQYLRAQRKGPIESILPELDKLKAFPDLQKSLVDRAYADLKKGGEEKQVSRDDIAAWMDTMTGLLFTMGRTFRRHYPAMTDEDLVELIVKVGAGEVAKARDQLNREAAEGLTGKKLPAVPQEVYDKISKES